MKKDQEELSLETTAYIVQQTEEIRPYMTPKGELLVVEMPIKKVLRKMKKREEDTSDLEKFSHCVEFQIKDEEGSFSVQGFGLSLEEASLQAKHKTLKIFSEILDQVETDAERHANIQKLMNKQNTIH